MPNTAFTQQGLAASITFHKRVQNALATVAWQVLNEDLATPNNLSRVAYARAVIQNLPGQAIAISPWLVDRPNLVAFETSYDFESASVVTVAGDADIESQLATDWNVLAGTPPQIP